MEKGAGTGNKAIYHYCEKYQISELISLFVIVIISQSCLSDVSQMNEHNNECCVTRTSLNTCIRMDTRDDPLVPAHGMLLSGSHSLAANMRGHYSHMVGSLQCN